MKKLKKSKKTFFDTNILKIEDTTGIKTLYPGDDYELSFTINGNIKNMECDVNITSFYMWDGEVLRLKMKEL